MIPRRELRDLAFVPRWGIARVIHRQSVAEHSFFVVAYSDYIADAIGWTGHRGSLLEYAYQHDLAEAYTSDIPGPVKRSISTPVIVSRYEFVENEARFGALQRPTDGERAIVKCADLIDEVCYLRGEQQLGNGAVGGYLTLSEGRLHDAWLALPGRPDMAKFEAVVYPLLASETLGTSQAP